MKRGRRRSRYLDYIHSLDVYYYILVDSNNEACYTTFGMSGHVSGEPDRDGRKCRYEASHLVQYNRRGVVFSAKNSGSTDRTFKDSIIATN